MTQKVNRRIKRKLMTFLYCGVCKGYFENRNHEHMEKGQLTKRNIYITKITEQKELIMNLWRFDQAFEDIIQISTGKETFPLKTFNGLRPKKMISNLMVDFLANFDLQTCPNKDMLYFSSTTLIRAPKESQKMILTLVKNGKIVLLPILLNLHWFLVIVSINSLLIYDSMIRDKKYYEKISLIQALELEAEIGKLELVENYPQQVAKSNYCGIIMISAIKRMAQYPDLIKEKIPGWGFDQRSTSQKRLEFAEAFLQLPKKEKRGEYLKKNDISKQDEEKTEIQKEKRQRVEQKRV